jgi:hypothetical protein
MTSKQDTGAYQAALVKDFELYHDSRTPERIFAHYQLEKGLAAPGLPQAFFFA